MSYKHITEYDDHFVMHHKDGHEVKIAKKGVSKNTIGKLQGFAKGGEVKEGPISKEEADKFNAGFNSQTIRPKPKEPNPKLQAAYMDEGGLIKLPPAQDILQANADQLSTPVQEEPKSLGRRIGESLSPIGSAISTGIHDTADTYKRLLGGIGSFAGDVAGGATGTPVAAPNVQAAVMTDADKGKVLPANINLGVNQQTQQPAYNPASDVVAAEAVGPGMQYAALQQQANTEQQIGKIKATEAEQKATEYENQQKAYNDLREHEANALSEISLDSDKLVDEINTAQLDPRRLFSNMGYGDRFMTALALGIGGIGSGLTGQPNAAMQFLNKMMDQDLEAQRANLDKKQNLLNYNLKKYGNVADAYRKSKLDLMVMSDAKLNQIQNSNAAPLAKQNAALIQQQLKAQMAPLVQQVVASQAAARMMNASMQQGPSNQFQISSQLINRMVPEKQQAEAHKELDRIKNTQESADKIMNAWDAMNEQNTIGGRAKRLGFEPASVGVWENMMLPLIKDKEGRVNEFEFDTVKKLKPKPGDLPDKVAQKREGLKQWIMDKQSSSLLEGHNIPIPKLVMEQELPSSLNYKPAGYKK